MHLLDQSFSALDVKKDGYIDFDELQQGMEKIGLDSDEDIADILFNIIDSDQDGVISRDDWHQQMLFVPVDSGEPVLKAAYMFFIEELDLSSEGDVLLSSESSQGLGYFLAGGIAGVVSRTCTAPFDRLKVYLIAQSGSQNAAASAAKTASGTAASAVAKRSGPIISAIRAIWSQGGVRAFFLGNGLNVVKVFPESAVKFGSFEAVKRLLARIEGVSDPSELSRASTFLAGGLGGMCSQLIVYPIDTLKFRVQCEAVQARSRGRHLMLETATKMWKDAGVLSFYRGLYVGVLGIFPFAALDLGIFSAVKRAYIKSQALKYSVDESEIKCGTLVVLTMGAVSGSIGASAVYPVNLLRTRLQAQGTAAHPYRYKGFWDVFHKTIQRDGYRGLYRGLAPNLAKVAPAMSISYVVYEKAKQFMHLE